MNISIIVNRLPDDEEGKKCFEAFAFTTGYGVKALGRSEATAMRNLHKKLKEMNRFSRLSRSALETKMKWHNCKFKINKKSLDNED